LGDGKLITVGFTLELIDDDNGVGLADIAVEPPTNEVADCDTSCRRAKPRLFRGAAVVSGIFALAVSVDATTVGPVLVETVLPPLLLLDPGNSTGQRLQVE
jgi:hypothetical protein